MQERHNIRPPNFNGKAYQTIYKKNNLRQSQPFPESDQLNHLGLHASEEYNYLKKIPPEGALNNFSHIEN